MLGKNDVVPMLLNISLIIGGVALICIAGTLPETTLRQYVEDAASGAASIVMFVFQSLILIFVGGVAFNCYKSDKKLLCLCVGFFGFGFVLFLGVVLLPFVESLYSWAGDYFMNYIKAVSK
ncbi:hypothetical protein ACVVI9_003978 [Escherichia coli]